jgi:membrane associated rhomboid family serine protease
MTLRGIAREFQEFPATIFFCMLWIVVFLTMIGSQFAEGVHPPWLNLTVLGVNAGHRFGDLALEDINRGEVWRLVTSTFVHYSVAHIALNLLAFYQLGTLLESWYGSHQSVMIYGVTGGGGNLISVLIRYRNGSSPHVHSAGGSVVIMGLVALCAVAGLRSRTRMGKWLGWQMVFFMLVTALLGIAFPRYLDNWGHLGGAVVGAVLGLAHRRLLRLASRPSAWGPSVVVGLVMGACGVAQLIDDRLEAPARQEQVVHRLAKLEQVLQRRARRGARSNDPKILLDRLADLEVETVLDPGTLVDFRLLCAQLQNGTARPLSFNESQEINWRFGRVIEQIHRRYIVEWSKLWLQRRDARNRRLQHVGLTRQRLKVAREKTRTDSSFISPPSSGQFARWPGEHLRGARDALVG